MNYFVADFSSERKGEWTDIKPLTREKQINREKRDGKAKSVGSIVTVVSGSRGKGARGNGIRGME